MSNPKTWPEKTRLKSTLNPQWNPLGLEFRVLFCQNRCIPTNQKPKKHRGGEFEAPKHGFPMGSAFKDFETLQEAFSSEGSVISSLEIYRVVREITPKWPNLSG